MFIQSTRTDSRQLLINSSATRSQSCAIKARDAEKQLTKLKGSQSKLKIELGEYNICGSRSLIESVPMKLCRSSGVGWTGSWVDVEQWQTLNA